MRLDAQGFLWLSDLWVASITIVAAIVLLFRCHRCLEAADSERMAPSPVRVPSDAATHRRVSSGGVGVSDRVTTEREGRDARRRRVV